MIRPPAQFYLCLALAAFTAQDAEGQHRGGKGPAAAAAARKRQVVWDFGGRQQTGAGAANLGPTFGVEPPSLVEYLNSTGAVIACRPENSGSGVAADSAKRVAASGAPISVSWRQMPSAGLQVLEQQDDEEQTEDNEAAGTGWLELDEREGLFVRQDGALVVPPGRARPQQVYRCCLANQFGSLCSRPVRTRAVPDASGLSLEVFEELAQVGGSARLRCLSPPSVHRYLEVTHWLKDDKIIASTERPANQQQLAINQKYLMLATGELIIRNVSRQADATKSSGFKCKARHRITGQLLTTKVGARIIIDDPPAAANQQLENRPQSSEPMVVWAQENSDQLICGHFWGPGQARNWPNSAKFLWYHEQQPLSLLEPQAGGYGDNPEAATFRQLDSCLLIRQVQLKHAGKYVCETHGGQQRSSVQLLVSSARLTAQLQLTHQAGPPEPQLGQPNSRAPLVSSGQQWVQLGSSYQLNCSIWGRPYDTIAWFKDSHLLAVSSSAGGDQQQFTSRNHSRRAHSGQSLDAIPASNNLRLVLPNVIRIEKFSLKNRGIYQCQVYSAWPQQLNQSSWLVAAAERDQLRSASASMELDLAPIRPSLVQKFAQNLALERNSGVALQCSAFGLPAPTFIWYLDGFPILNPVSRETDQTGHSWDDFGREHSGSEEYSAQYRQFLRLANAARSNSNGARQGNALNNVIQDERFKISTHLVGSEHPLQAANKQDHEQQQSSIVVSWLNISQMEPTEMGNYKCLAFNSLGFVQHSAYLAIGGGAGRAGDSNGNNELRIERRHYQPSKVNALGGQATWLQCPLVGHPLVRVDWFRQDDQRGLVALPSSHRQRVEPINKWGFGGQLELLNADRAAGDEGLYSCRVGRQTGPAGTNSNQTGLTYDDDLVGQVRVQVRLAPLIDRQTLPELVHTNEGMRAKLVCSIVQGDHPVEIRWLRRTATLLAGSGSGSGQPDEDNKHARTAAGTSGDQSQWQSRGRGQTGAPSEWAATFAAGFEEIRPGLGPARGTKQQTSDGHGESARPEGETQEQEASVSIHNLEDSSLLTFRQISYLDGGDYLCLASNQVGHSSRLTRVLVNVAPTWSFEPPSELSVLVGSRLQIDCLAHAFPEPSITWKRRRLQQQQPTTGNPNGEQQWLIESQRLANNEQEFAEIGPNYRRRQPANGSLIIEQSDQSDAGWYMCQIGNGIGVGLSKVIRVRVNVGPHFKSHRTGSSISQLPQQQQQQLVQASVGARAELKCVAFGDQPMIIGWRRDHTDDVVDLLNDSRHRLVSEHKLAPTSQSQQQQALESVLQIDNLTRQDSGSYVCVASNEFGTEESRLQLIVQEPPEAPALMRPIRAGSRQATLSFRLPYSGNSPIRQYAIYYRALAASANESSFSKLPDWQQSLVDAQQAAPSALGGQQQFSLQTMQAETNSSSGSQLVLTQQDSMMQEQLVNLLLCCLQPFTRYLVKVRAINELGQGEPSRAVAFVTDEEAIGGPPLDVAVEPTGAHSLKVRWRPPAKHLQNGLIRGYYIGYRAIGPAGQMQAALTNPDPAADNPEQYQYKNVQLDPLGSAGPPTLDPFGELLAAGQSGEWAASNYSLPPPAGRSQQSPLHLSSYLTNLKRKLTYSIIVQAYNKVGAGPRSDQIVVSTLDAAPPMSPILKVLSVGYNVAQLIWSSRRLKQQDNNATSQTEGLHRRLIIDATADLGPANGLSAKSSNDMIADADLAGSSSSSDPDSDSDDPQSHYTLHFRPDPLPAGPVSSSAGPSRPETDWQQRRVPARRQSAQSPYQLTNLKCGSRYSAFMTATNSLGQSEPGEVLRFATMGAAPIAPSQTRDFLQVNSSYAVLRLGQWQNAGCLIGAFLLKYRPLNQLKWTVLEHQVHPTIQTLTVSGSALFSTRAQSTGGSDLPALMSASGDQEQRPGRHQLAAAPIGGHQAPARGSKFHTAQLLSDFIIRNLTPDTNYKLIVEANSEAGSTLAEYEFETANFTSSMVAISVNGLSAAELANSDSRPYSLVEPADGGELLDFNYGAGQQPGLASSTIVGPLHRYALGVWSLTALFVVGSILMAVATLVLGLRSIMRMKPGSGGSPDGGGGLVSALLCCSGFSSSARSSSSDNADSSHSSSAGSQPLGSSCYQLPHMQHSHQHPAGLLDPATSGYCSLAAAGLQQAGPTGRPSMGHFLHGADELKSMMGEPAPFRQLVSSSSLSTIGRSAGGHIRSTHTLGRQPGDRGPQLRSAAAAACYAATLGKQQSTFVCSPQTPLKFHQQDPIPSPLYGRLHQQQQQPTYQDDLHSTYSGEPAAGAPFTFNPQPMSSSGGTSGYETSANSMLKLDCPANEMTEQQPVYLTQNNYHQHRPADGLGPESNLYGSQRYQQPEQRPQLDAQQLNYGDNNNHTNQQQQQQLQKAAFSISGNKIDCDQLISSAYGMIFGNQQQNKQDCQQQQQLEPLELANRLQALNGNNM